MAYKIFIDVNILVDAFLDFREGNADAFSIIDMADNHKLKCYLSESVINTTVYLTRKSIKADAIKAGLTEILSFMQVLPCSNETVISAYHNAKSDLEDAVLYQIALENKLDYFVTSDVKDYKKIEHPLLPVVTAKKLLGLIL